MLFPSRSLLVFFALLFVPALAGCPSPNTYATPRTVATGKIAHTVAAEGVGAVVEDVTAFLPTLPTYQIRTGLTDSVDVGGRISNASSFGADIKWNPVRGDFDLALAPGFQVARLSRGDVSGAIGYVNLPLILGFNPTEWFSLVPTVGATMAFSSAEDLSTNDAAITGTGFLLRTGVGANFRVSEGFAIQPEITGLINPDTGGLFLSYGVGFNFGDLPVFGGD